VAAHRVAVIGLGEAGSLIAGDLAARGIPVIGWDPAVDLRRAGVTTASSARDAAARSDVVLSVNSATAAVGVAEQTAPVLTGDHLYADLNTAGPSDKERIAGIVEGAGALFADVALMAPVPGRGITTPALTSGSGGVAFAEIFRPLDMPVDVVGPRAGAAAARKLLRSVFVKGMTAAMLESLAAARALGCETWLEEQITRTLVDADGAFVRRLIEGSRRHAGRRVVEMEQATALLESVGVPPNIASAARTRLQLVADGRSQGS
jgi:3-hydroxyisobutyrate dehydrogenase-like beta-hydroxyacid dehydrogenase